VFAMFFELVIQPKIIKLSDCQYRESHFGCCTFNTRRQNTRRGLTRIQIAPCCKMNFTKDWDSYWFYVKVKPCHPRNVRLPKFMKQVRETSFLKKVCVSEESK
jgi:hypothetical protein